AVRDKGFKIPMFGELFIESISIDRVTFYTMQYWLKYYAITNGLFIINRLIENKKFEKEADEFACKVVGKSEGLIQFFEYLLAKEKAREDEFITIYNVLQSNK